MTQARTVLLARNFASTSGAQIDITGLDAYDEIELTWFGIDKGGMLIQLSSDGGSSFISTSGYYARAENGEADTITYKTSTWYFSVGNAPNYGHARIKFHNMADVPTIGEFFSASSTVMLPRVGLTDAAAAHDAMRINFSGATATSGWLFVTGIGTPKNNTLITLVDFDSGGAAATVDADSIDSYAGGIYAIYRGVNIDNIPRLQVKTSGVVQSATFGYRDGYVLYDNDAVRDRSYWSLHGGSLTHWGWQRVSHHALADIRTIIEYQTADTGRIGSGGGGRFNSAAEVNDGLRFSTSGSNYNSGQLYVVGVP